MNGGREWGLRLSFRRPLPRALPTAHNLPMMGPYVGFVESPMPSELPNTPSSTNVVDLAQRQPSAKPSPAAGTGLWGTVARLTQSALSEGLSATFSSVDNDLFKRSESDQELFEGLRELRKRQPMISRLFSEKMNASLFLSDRPVVASSVAAPPAKPELSLSLVDDSELEENLAISGMVSVADSALAGELHALRQRLAVVRGGVDPEKVHIPMAPRVVAQSFRESLEGFTELTLPLRIVLYKHFERHTLGALGPLYHALNKEMAASGVLKDIKPQPLIRNHADPSRSDPILDEDDGSGLGRGEEASPETQAAWKELRSLVSAGRQGGGESQGPAATIRELAQALSALREIHTLLGQLSTTGVAPQDVKEHLLKQLGKGTDAAKSLGAHEDAIDTVGLIFDHILKDPNLPPPMQAILARLQVPFIKVAVLEPQLFAKPGHPARQLLNLLGETGKKWSLEADPGKVLHAKINEVVESINHDFADDAKVFEHQEALFRTFVEASKEKASLTESRAEEVARSRDKMEKAQTVVTAALLERLSGQALPEWMRMILSRHWASFMVSIAMREGEESQAFRNALYFVDSMVNASKAEDQAAKRSLETIIPSLVQQWRTGLAGVGIPAADLDSLTETLQAFLNLRAGRGSGSMPPEPKGLPAMGGAPRLAKKAGPAPKPESLERVKKMKIGEWIELDDKQRRTRGKVSWISSFTGRVLIVGVNGTRLCEKTQEELALMFENNHVRLLETKPLFDRAVGSIMDKFRK